MPGNKSVFTDALRKASNAAWDRRWDTAIREYKRAVGEFPSDASARSGLALALQEANRFDEALAEYRALVKVQPNDPIPLARCAVLLERMGPNEEAFGAYMQLAEMYQAQKQMNKAVEAWRQASALGADRSEPHEKMAEAFTEAGHVGAAAREWVALARLAQRAKDHARAMGCVERALQIEPDNTQAKLMLAELTGNRSGNLVPPGTNPIELARQSALSRLAAAVLDDKLQWRRGGDTARSTDLDAVLARAIDAQGKGQTRDAIQLYEQLLAAGLVRTEVQFNLAVLYQNALQHGDAIRLLSETVHDREYAVPSHFALGQSLRAQGKVDEAIEHYIQAMKIVDLSRVNRAQADQVIRLYQSLAEGYRAQGDQANAEKFSETLLKFLGDKGWQDKVREVRQHIEASAGSGTPLSLEEVFDAPEAPRIIELLTASRDFLKQGKHYASSDLAYQAIELAPYYLPTHVQIAEIAVAAGQVAEAQSKFDALAATAEVRHDLPKAISFYRRALKLSPDLTRRSKLINVLVQGGQVTDALSEYGEVGRALEAQGQFQKAADKYQEALALARRVGVAERAVAGLNEQLGEVYSKLGEWNQAIALFQELKRVVPYTERALIQLVALYAQTGRVQESQRELDELLTRYADQPEKSLAGLNRLTTIFPNQVFIYRRLAQQLAATNQLDKAIETLDELGDRLLTEARVEDAVQVIQDLITLNPPQVDQYKNLLQELKSQVA